MTPEQLQRMSIELIERFFKLSKEQFLALPPMERSLYTGAVIGNFAVHHPAETFDLLRKGVTPRLDDDRVVIAS